MSSITNMPYLFFVGIFICKDNLKVESKGENIQQYDAHLKDEAELA
jgi:hypothetical protein